MQVMLTKKLADVIKGDFDHQVTEADENPLFSWTANWTNVWDGQNNDMLVLINNATRFVVAVYQIGKKDLENPEKVKQIIYDAITNTLLSMNVNPVIIDEYIRHAGVIRLRRNSDRRAASWVTHGGNDCAFFVGREYEIGEKVFDDTCGVKANARDYGSLGYGLSIEKRMFKALTDLTGKQIFKYRALEIIISLDLEIYKAERRLMVPERIKLKHLHKVLQNVFGWWDYHLYDFTVPGKEKFSNLLRLVPYEDDLEYDEKAILMENHTLGELLPKHEKIIYTYDMGDYWEHEIKLVNIHENYDEESPYLLESKGQSPPEDVGGVGGFLDFREIILDPEHPDHEAMKVWSRNWSPELGENEMRPRRLYFW